MYNDRQETSAQGGAIITKTTPIVRHREVRDLILDYAIAAALIGLIPLPVPLTIKLLITNILELKMMRDVGSKYGYPKGQDLLAIAGNIFGGIGAYAIALMAWVTVFCIGLFFPVIGSFAISASLFTLTWALGQVTLQFYASGRQRN